MREHQPLNSDRLQNDGLEVNYEHLLAQLRQDQLEAALAGRMAESAFFAAEAQALRDEIAQDNALCA
jgi:hypothetical protein